MKSYVPFYIAVTDAMMSDYEEPTDLDDYDNPGEIAETDFMY